MLQDFMECEKKYYLSHSDKLTQIGTKKAFATGTWVHELLRRVNRAKANRRRKFTLDQLLQIGYKFISRTKGFTQEERLFHTTKFTQFMAWNQRYWEFYRPIGVEVGFSKVLYEDADVVFVYEGKIDQVAHVIPADFVTWIDYKSQSREYNLYANRNQLLGYSWALNTDVGYLLYYGLQKEKLEAFRYQTIYHPKPLIEQWKRETIEVYRQILTTIPFGASAFRRNRAVCDSGQFGNCEFIKICDNAWAPLAVQASIRRTFYKPNEWSTWK